MSKKKVIELITEATLGVATNKEVQKMFLGTYSDGTIRSVKDCLDGEILSPKQKGKLYPKKKTKKKKKKNKQKKIDLY